MALSPTVDGSQRLLFSHDLVSGRYRSSVRFGLVRMIHGEEDFNSDSDLDDGGGGLDGGGGGGGGRVPGGSDTESAADPPSRPLGRGFVRVQWYPEGAKQDIRETKVSRAGDCPVGGLRGSCFLTFQLPYLCLVVT